ncbi:PaaI family thioesterase [Pseudotenacibaculum haliotis]|uniref:PaaI family thioesterase n=1 Tax=Pseudotenacibaculum haliotis TaxID=1862138 RepID=A0ABW5LTC6_9FLAO
MDKEQILKGMNERSENTLMETLDIEYVDLGKDYLTAKMPVGSKVHQPFGQLHGGATAALAETVASTASYFFLEDKNQLVNGIELTINHVKSKREGEVFATARNIHKGRTTQLWEVEIVDEEGNLISICKMTSIVLEKRK